VETPSTPGGVHRAKQAALRTRDGAGAKAGAKARGAAGSVAGSAVAVPGQVARLGRLVTLRRLLRVAPAVAAAGAVVVVVRRLARGK
jgi:hypothetical protein